MTFEQSAEQLAQSTERAVALIHQLVQRVSVLETRVVFWKVIATALALLHVVAVVNHYIFGGGP